MILSSQKDIRKAKIKARNDIPASVRGMWSDTICEKIIKSDIYKEADTIMLYRGVKGEANLMFLENHARMQQKTLVYPLCIGQGEMLALCPANEQAWKKGAFGIEEPDFAYAKEISPDEIDFIICPCTAFDEACNRIGMGGGYYDRFLPKCNHAVVAAVAFEVQKAEGICLQPWDYPMHMIFTEKNIYKV